MGSLCQRVQRNTLQQTQQHENPQIGIIQVHQQINKETSLVEQTMSFEVVLQSQKYKKFDNQHNREFILLPDCYSFKSNTICGPSISVKLTYKNYPYTLENQLKNRYSLNLHFNNQQICYIVYTLIKTAMIFQKNQQKSNMSLQNIFIDRDGMVKVFSRVSMPGLLDNWSNSVGEGVQHGFLAPQQLEHKSINPQQYPKNIDKSKSQIFRIGLIILSSGMLKNCTQIYNNPRSPSQKISINSTLLDKHIKQFGQNYNKIVYNILKNMLEINPVHRRKASQIYKQLEPYQQRIINFQAIV